MKILISNDDGINSNGLHALCKQLSLWNDILVVAPDENKSAISHSLSINKKLKLKEERIAGCKAYSLSGTPVDCIKFSRLYFNNFLPDIVVAGINKGHNLGSDILYSGTVSIAYEAAFFGHIAFSFSSFSLEESDFELYASYADDIINILLPYSVKGTIWNVNFPDSTKQIKGYKITELGKQLYSDEYVHCGNNEFYLTGELIDHKENIEDCDIEWIKKGYITITPIVFNKTDFNKIKEVKFLCEE